MVWREVRAATSLARMVAHHLRDHTIAVADGRLFYFVTGDDVAVKLGVFDGAEGGQDGLLGGGGGHGGTW